MEIRTIGFTKWSAEAFFRALREAGIRRLIDVRIHPTSQLGGFAKQRDLVFFLQELAGTHYMHEPLLAPTEELLRQYRKKEITWLQYEDIFRQLLSERQIERHVDPALFSISTVLLCSEHEATHCHRRLVAEYLGDHWEGVEIIHLDSTSVGRHRAEGRDALHGELAAPGRELPGRPEYG